MQLQATIDPQVTFDTVIEALRKQKEKSVDPTTGVCQYRYNGLKCAAGHLLTDEEYNTYPIEGQSVYTHLDEDDAALASRAMPTKLMLAKGHNLLLVKCLQRIHDQSEPPEWESQWKDLARVLDLDYNHAPVYAYEE